MFLGHIAVGLASKHVAPRVSLSALLTAPILLDLLWPLFLLLGWERVWIDPGNTAVTPLDFQHYPWSHSLLMTVVWAGLVGGARLASTRNLPGALVLGAGVTSHWVLDLVTHRPDLPLWPGGPFVGLGLWNSVGGTVLVEGAMFVAGLWLYMRDTRPRGWHGRLSFWSLIVTLLLVYWANLQPLPAEADERTIALMALAMWLLVPWAGWIERTRRTVRV